MVAAGQEDWLTMWRRKQWRWAGKLIQSQHHKWSYAALGWNPQLQNSSGAKRARKRPLKRWEDDLEKFTPDWRRLAADDTKWMEAEDAFVACYKI